MQRFLNRLAGDVRQTLHHLQGLIELTLEEPVSDSQRQHLAHCRATADKLLRTANDLSELARPSAPPSSASPFDMAAMANEIGYLMSLLAARKNLDLTWQVDSSVPAVIVADRDLIEDILRRLLDNAIGCTATGSVRFSLTIETRSDAPLLLLEVSDTGSGMPEQALLALRSPSTDLEIEGLSLSIIRKRLDEMKGELEVPSTSPQGTTLRLRFPMGVASEEPVRADTSTLTLQHGFADATPLNLLVAEDSNDSFAVFQAFVKGQGHRVARASDGAQAVDMVKSGQFDLIVMDVNMPIMDGYTATRAIRDWETSQGRHRLPIVLLSADDAARQVRMGAAAGCSGYLTKPATKSQVLKALKFYSAPQAAR